MTVTGEGNLVLAARNQGLVHGFFSQQGQWLLNTCNFQRRVDCVLTELHCHSYKPVSAENNVTVAAAAAAACMDNHFLKKDFFSCCRFDAVPHVAAPNVSTLLYSCQINFER